MVRSAARRALKRAGRSVTIRNYTQNGTERPDWNQTSGSPYTVKARVDYRSTPRQVSDEFGASPDIDVDVWIDETAAGGVSEIRDGGGQGASEIDVDEITLVVILKDVQDNGLMRLSCVRET